MLLKEEVSVMLSSFKIPKVTYKNKQFKFNFKLNYAWIRRERVELSSELRVCGSDLLI